MCPALLPLFLDYPDDAETTKIDDEFLFGSDLLVAPVLWEGVQSRSVYLPAGDWYDYWTGQHYSGQTRISIPVTLDSIPIYVRGGGFIFRQPVVQHTGQMPGNPLRVLIAPAASSSASFYEDDGESLRYRDGDFMRREFRQTRDPQLMVVEASAPEGSWRPAKRDLIFETWPDRASARVVEQVGGGTNSGEAFPQLNPDDLAKAPRGWSYSNGLLTIKDNDRFEAVRFEIQN